MDRILQGFQNAIQTAGNALAQVPNAVGQGARRAGNALLDAVQFLNNNVLQLYNNLTGRRAPANRIPRQPRRQPAPVNADDRQLAVNMLDSLGNIYSAEDANINGVSQVHVYSFPQEDTPVFFNNALSTTGYAILETVNRARARTSMEIINAPQGYNTEVSVTFYAPEQQAFITLEFSNAEISYDRVMQRMQELEQGTNYDYFLYSIRVMIYKKPTQAGGCREAREKKFKLQINKKDVVVISPQSSKNNCAIMCFLKKLGLKGNGVNKPDTIRKALGFKPNEMIDYKDLARLSGFFGVGHIVYDGDDGYKIIGECDLKNERIIEIVLEGEHYMYIDEDLSPTKCDKCGITFKRFHKCNLGVVSYFQSRFVQDSQNWVTVPPEMEIDKVDPNSLVFFDIETLALGDGKVATPYAVGWKYEGKIYKTYGKDCFEMFLDEVVKWSKKTLIAYNGARFDFYPLVNGLMKRGVKIDKHIESHGRLLSVKFNKNSCFDLCLFTLSTLEKACKDFKCEFNKTDFNHGKMKSWDDVELYRDEVEPYLQNDVECLEDLFHNFNNLVYELEGVNINKFFTLSQMGYHLWTKTLQKSQVQLFHKAKDRYDFVKKAIYGGRCYPLVRETKSQHYDEIVNGDMTYEELYKSKDYLFNLDATSLYPASMRGIDLCKVKYPVGESRWADNPEHHFRNGKIGFYKVRWSCPDRKLRVAVLPSKSKGGMRQTLEGGEGVYTNVDLENAELVGYKFDFLDECLIWDESSDTLFNEYVDKWFGMKKSNSKKGGNKSLKSMSKLLINGLFGKTLQGILSDGSAFCYSIHDIWAFRKKYKINDFNVWDSDKGKTLRLAGTMIDDEQERSIRKPVQLGAFILAYSRRIMLQYMRMVDHTLHTAVFTYMDTDSMHVSGEAHQRLIDAGAVMHEDDSDLGFLCSDIDNAGLIIREVNMGSKNYYYEYIDNTGKLFINEDGVMKAKGIPKKDGLGTGDKIITSSLWNNQKAETLSFTSFKKVRVPSRKDKELGVEPYSIRTIEQTRTWLKNDYSRCIYKDNEYYPHGFLFE